MTQVITNSLPMGVPGDLSRLQAIVESYNQNVALPVLLFGVPVKLGVAADTVSPIVAGGTSAEVVGFMVRAYPSMPGSMTQNDFAQGTPLLAGPVSVMKSGYMIVRNNFGTPAKEGLVHMRIGAPTVPRPLGGIEAAADGVNTVVLVGAAFMGAADFEGSAEIRFRVGN